MDLHVRMTAEQYARYQALVKVLRKGRVKEDKAELLLAGLEQLVLGATGDVSGERDVEERSGIQSKKFPRVNSRSPYQVVVQKCPDCNRATGGPNIMDNLITLCSGCHIALHGGA